MVSRPRHDRHGHDHHGDTLEAGHQGLEEIMQTFYFDTSSGKCLGSFGPGTILPPLAEAAPLAPSDGRQIWNGQAWIWPVEIIRDDVLDQVSARYQAALAAGLSYGGKV